MESSLTVKLGLARTHFRNAKMYRDQMRRIEAQFADAEVDTPQQEKEQHKAAFIGCIFSCAATIECYSKEFVSGVIDEYERIEEDRDISKYDIGKDKIRKIATYSDNKHPNPMEKVDKRSSPYSLNAVLEMAGLDIMEESSQEKVKLIFKMRDKLYHHEPKWIEGGPKEHTNNEYGFEYELKNEFDLNPLTAEGDAFFPSQCQSASCAEWSVRHTRHLLKMFGDRIDHDLQFPGRN